MWARTGDELFFLGESDMLMSASVRTTPAFSHGNPEKLFETSGLYLRGGAGNSRSFDVSSDGQRFLMIKDGTTGDQNAAPANMVVVLNWLEELKAKLPTK